ncbi:MAG TPA: large conductance mechanosensitive channel protein MscL [Candidatus Egerieimonas intestinavium]|uniref:Large-conductance mechanosensitive channel n=1 Tax=Candidatus Egerieimonas intestinavium TaxID=2840777 RepID=A0A9D1JGW7_9FIRM|nr:large conductance mechanosensitive channel protein MscL [Candidatus Egerieimonas intestinavium]
MKKFIQEFKEFALRGNMMDMAVGVLIGGAFSDIVGSLTNNFINPVLNVVTGGQTYTLAEVAGFASSFLSALVQFFIMAFVLFCLLKGINKLAALGHKPEEPEAPATQICPFCKSEISIDATRCPHCTSVIEKAVEEIADSAAEAEA